MSKITSGDRLAVPDPVDRVVKFTTTLERKSAVEGLPVPQGVTVVVFLRYGIWYSLSITRMKMGTAPCCPDLILIPVWGWREPPL